MENNRTAEFPEDHIDVGTRLAHKENPDFVIVVKDIIYRKRGVQVVIEPLGQPNADLLRLLDEYDMNDGDVTLDTEEWEDGITPLHTDFIVR